MMGEKSQEKANGMGAPDLGAPDLGAPDPGSTATTAKSRVEAALSLSAARARFEERNPVSKELHGLAVQSLPGGNTRTLLHTSPFPLTMKRGKGPYVWSGDGHK